MRSVNMGQSSRSIFKFALFLFFVSHSTSVDESLFKKCSQSAFCSRLRRLEPQESRFVMLTNTSRLVDSVLSVELLNTETLHWYKLSLSAVHPRIFHFEIDERGPLSERYRVKDALAHELVPREIQVDEITEQRIVISEGDKMAIVQADPFRLDFYLSGSLLTSVNSRGLLQFEHLRLKPEHPSEGEWEEEFNGFVDSKPKGPESLGLDFMFPQAEVLYGIPEHADDFILKDTTKGSSDPYRLYNLDVNSYVVNSKMALYGSVPVLYGHGVNGSSGVFWQNVAETWVDIDLENAPSSNFISESGIIDTFILLGSSPMETFQQFTALTGSAPLPQMYSLGYHQSRWNYDNDSDVAMIDSKFAEHDIPLDSIWLDIEYTDEKRYFTWDHVRFPNPLEMIQNLTENDRHLTIIIDPHVKVDEYYFFHENCSANDYYVKDKDRNDYQGWCWPGLSSYTDFLNPYASKYYSDQFLLTNFKESTREVGLWNDMNEPAVFNGPEITMQKDNVHYGGWEHRDVHNIFGHYHVMATHDGLIRRNEGTLRPFVLTRAFFAGTQRYAAVWTGDNTADWGHMQATIKMCLSLSVAGISFCGADVGGFFNDPSAELIARWYQLGAFQPFFRVHSHEATRRREPWLWPEETKQIIRSAIQKRYQLLPYWYTLFYEHERFGRPVMKPLLAQYPWDRNTFRLEKQYLLGDQLLVAPVLEAGQRNVNVYFPLRNDNLTEIWYDLDNFNKYNQSGSVEIPADSNKIPVFQRGGTIIPSKSIVRKSSVAMRKDPYTLLVALDAHGYARGELYVDDEESFEYRNGKYQYLEVEFHNKVLSMWKIDTDTSLEREIVFDRIVIAGLAGFTNTAEICSASGMRRRISLSENKNIKSIERANVLFENGIKIVFS